jgi:fumarate reductase subunit D
MQENIKEIQEGKFFALSSYVTFLCIIRLGFKKNNKFALYHAKQGLVLFVFEVAAFILSIVPFLGGTIKITAIILFSLASLWGILQALAGRYARIPLISNIADKIIL